MKQPDHQGLDQVSILFVIDALEVKALDARERELVLDVVEDGMIDTVSDPFAEIAVEFFRQEEIRKPAILRVEQVDISHGFVDHVIVFGFQLRPAIGEQQLDKGIEELDIALSGFQRERIHARAIGTDPVNAAVIEFNDALIAPADVEDVREGALA